MAANRNEDTINWTQQIIQYFYTHIILQNGEELHKISECPKNMRRHYILKTTINGSLNNVIKTEKVNKRTYSQHLITQVLILVK